MSNRFRRLPLWLSVFMFSPLQAQRSEPLTPQTLTLTTAVERTLARNPELKAFGYELEVQRGRIEFASARPALEVGATVEDVLGGSAHSGFDVAQTTLTLGWVWERGLRDQRLNAAQTNLSALQSESNLRRLDAATETARRFLAVLTHQQELDELRRAVSLAEETHATVIARVEAAKAPEAEASRAYAQKARAQLEVEHEEHELLTASSKLAAMWGQPVTDANLAVAVVQGDLFALPPLPDFATLNSRLQNNPHLAKLLTTQRLRDAELQLASAQARPAWQFTGGVRRYEATNDEALVFGVTVPLTNRNQLRGALAAAHAQSEQVQAHGESLRLQLNTELFAVYQEMKHAYTETAALREEVLPRMETALAQSRYAYERGRYSYMEWLAAQREVTEVRRALIMAAANAHRYRIEVERLTGATLDQSIAN